MATPRVGAPELVEGQAAPETTVNEIARFMEQGGGSYFPVFEVLSTPPVIGSVDDSSAYIVGASPTGAWSTFAAGSIAFKMNTAWENIPVYEGTLAYRYDTNKLYLNDGSGGTAAWVSAGYEVEPRGLESRTGL